MNVGVYARVSTSSQSCEVQLFELERYCKARKWNIVERFIDDGMSGVDSTRPSFKRLMTSAFQRKFDVVLVYSFDRFSRSSKELLNALSDFEALGIDFISLKESLDTKTPTGKLLFTVIASFAEFERSMNRERISEGLHKARRKGKKLGRPNMVTDYIREKIIELRKGNMPIRKIAHRLSISKSLTGRVVAALERDGILERQNDHL